MALKKSQSTVHTVFNIINGNILCETNTTIDFVDENMVKTAMVSKLVFVKVESVVNNLSSMS